LERMLEVDVRKTGGTVLVSLAGELDGYAASRIDERVLGAADETDVERLLLDLGKVTYIDSGGMALLTHLHRHARRDGFFFAIVGPSSRVRSSLAFTGLLDELVVLDDPREAAPSDVQRA
jgi:anti-anti-sigma factor